MRISYDPAKRNKTFRERGLDFEDAAAVFAGTTYEIEDSRRDYGEQRMICYGYMGHRMVVVCYTPRGGACHVFSMRKANEREQAHYAPYLKK